MAVTPHLDLRQTQSLLMTPELRQAINLLQVSNLELSQLIEKELESNPLLEREDDRVETFDTGEINIDNPPGEQAPTEVEDFVQDNTDCDNQFDDYGSDREGYEEAPQHDWEDYAVAKTQKGDETFDFVEEKLANTSSLYQTLEKQISLMFQSPRDRAIAIILSEQLDEAGYFRGDVKAISTQINLNITQVQAILNKMKEFEPTGIFAENLAECLKIQLKDLGRLDPLAEKVLDNLGLIGENKVKELKKVCQINEEDFASVMSDIRSLNPKPAAAFHHDITSYIIPDVFIRRHKKGGYHVELNSMSLPRILINRQYCSEIKNSDKNTGKYIKQQLSSASFLVKALHQRAETILKVSEEILKNQYDFFENGIDHLKPMQLKNISEEIEMHESTVSRAVNNKYMHTPRGIFELKYFFSGAAGSYIGDENTSTLTIKHKIKKLIEEETPGNIYSDDKIVDLLGQTGIKIARRTITKYREAMNIPSSAERKRSKRNKL